MARLFNTPNAGRGPTRGPRASFGEVIGNSFVAEREQLWTRDRSREAEADAPFWDFLQEVTSGENTLSDETVDRLWEQGFEPDDELLNDVIAEAQGLGYAVPDEVRPEALRARREEIMAASGARVKAAEEVIGRANPAARFTGSLIGGIGAGSLDPVNVATLPLGAPGRLGFLRTVLVEGGINAGIEAAQTPGRNVTRAELGLEAESALQNAAMGFALGGAFAALGKGLEIGLKATQRAGSAAPATTAEIEAAEALGSDEATVAADAVRRDVEDQAAAVVNSDPGAAAEHVERFDAAAQAAEQGGLPDMPDRPTTAQAAPSIVNGELTEVRPDELAVQPDVFQFKSDIVAEGGVTAKLVDVTEWRSERAGIAIVFEYEDGTQAIADGHQRVALAKRISAQTGQDIRLAARVFREVDGFTPEDIRVLAALKNIAEAADGMTAAMARDAAKVLRVDPAAIAQLPAGPGVGRAQALSKLSDDAFDLYINDVVPERFAELVGRLVENPELHLAMMRLLENARPETTAQAESVLRQAMAAPIAREVTEDLFGETEVVASLYLERAKVLERAQKLLREDRQIFRTLDERAGRIQEAGENRLDELTNREMREAVEKTIAAMQSLAYRAGPISEALNNGAQSYKETGRLKDAAQAVADAVRQEIERNGLAGLGAGDGGRGAKPADEGAATPDIFEAFDEPGGQGAAEQIAATKDALQQRASFEDVRAMDPAEARQLQADLKDAQGFTSIDDIMARGAKNHDELNAAIAEISLEVGTKQKAAPLKSRDRTEAKVRNKYAGNYNKITDVARGGVDAETPEQADAFLAALASRYRVVDEGYTVTGEGYFDRKAMVVMPDGMLAEVQIWPPGLLEAKSNGGHKAYEEFRLPETSPERKAELQAEMTQLYGGVRAQLDPSWERVVGGAGNESSAASSSDSANVRGSDSSSRAVSSDGSDQTDPVQTDARLRASETAPISEPSNRTSVMGKTSNTDIGEPGTESNQAIGDLLEAARARINDRAEAVERLAANDKPVKMQSGSGLTALVSPSPDIPGQWRITTFDAARKPTGHIDAADKRAALNRAFEDGFAEQQGGRATESTSAGEQTLIDGVAPITERDRLERRMEQPLGRGNTQQDDTQIGGLFDPNDPSRFDLFDAVPVDRGFDDDGNAVAVVKSRAELAAELDADDDAVAAIDACLLGAK